MERIKTELIGWISAILLAGCGIPEVIQAFRINDSHLTWPFLLMWFFGEVFALLYTIIKSKKVKLLPLIFNYGLNILCISVIMILKC